MQEKGWKKVFMLADFCRAMSNNGATDGDIGTIVGKSPTLVKQLIQLSKHFPEGERVINVPIDVYLAAALFPDPVATVKRAWEERLTADDLRNEVKSWAARFDALGYGDPPCLVPGDIYTRCKKTPIEEAIGIDEEGYTTAKRLYAFLELHPAAYSRWVRKHIEQNVFAEPGVDYVVFNKLVENHLGGRPTRDYKLTARFAKKLAMASDSPKGEAARNYFVTVEERAKAIAHGQKPTEWPADVLKGILQEMLKAV